MANIVLVSGAVIVENGRVLLVKHGDPLFWKFPGGRVEEEDATLKATASREAKEELGVEVAFADRPPYFVYSQKQTGEGLADVILVHFLATHIGEIVPGEDIREWQWLDLPSLPEDLAPNIRPTLEHFGFLKK